MADMGAATPFVAAITPRDEGIDNTPYDGREKPEMVRRDDEGWREL